MTRIAIVTGSTRPGRNGEAVARWVHEVATRHGDRTDATYELVDLATFDLPLLDEPTPPAMEQEPEHEHTRRWQKTVESFDAFVFVTPEYNHSTSGALKNALDYLFVPWHNKAAGFVGYGSAGGVRAVEHLRQICGELAMADVRAQVQLTFAADFEPGTYAFRPQAKQQEAVTAMLDQVLAWAVALRSVRLVSQRA